MTGAEALTTLATVFAAVTTAAASEIPCGRELGKEAAGVLVAQCLQVSPATHSPCNALNSCEMNRNEIRRGCEILLEAGKAPGFCVPSFVLKDRDAACIEQPRTPEEVAASIQTTLERCRITGRGEFEASVFIRIECRPAGTVSSSLFVFGSDRACNAFKNIDSHRYIKLFLETMMPDE